MLHRLSLQGQLRRLLTPGSRGLTISRRAPQPGHALHLKGIEHGSDRTVRHQPPRHALDIGRAPCPVRAASSHPCGGAGAGRGRPIAVVERWGSEAGHPRLRARHHRPVQPELRPSGGAHRDLRPGRNAVGRASDVLAGGLLPGSRPGGGGEAAGTQECRALQDRPLRQSGGDGEAVDAGPREDSRRDADRHDGGGVQRRGHEVARNGPASALAASLHRAGLSADARSSAPSARQRLQDLHRDRRRPGLRAHLFGTGLRHPARAGGRHRRRDEVRLWPRTASRS